MRSFLWYAVAAVLEIAGCSAFWSWLRQGGSAAIYVPLGLTLLAAFAAVLTRVDVAFAGRAFAAYGGIYVTASLGWLAFAEKRLPDQWDLLGAAMCIGGAAVIVLAPRA